MNIEQNASLIQYILLFLGLDLVDNRQNNLQIFILNRGFRSLLDTWNT